MTQTFTGTVISLKNLQTATVQIVSTHLHPKYHVPYKNKKKIRAHYETTEEATINWLIQYFQENNIKEISLENGKLVIIYHDNKTALLEKIIDRYEFQNIKDYLVKTTKQSSLTIERLKALNNPNSPKKEFPLKLGDKVVIKSSRPYSATKRFIVVEKY